MATEKEIARAKSTSIIDVAAAAGVNLVHDSGKYWRWDEHPSFVVDSQKNMWRWNSQDVGGDSIRFAMKMMDQSFPQAVRYLNSDDLSHVDISAVEKDEPFVYSPKDQSDFSKVTNYLVNQRKIDPGLVAGLHQSHLLEQDEHGNAVFVWSDGKSRVGGSLQGTTHDVARYGKHGAIKRILPNSQHDFGFNFAIGKPEKLLIFEAPIDAMSYISCYPQTKNTLVMAMDGVKPDTVIKAIVYQRERFGTIPEKIGIGVDNDLGGHVFMDDLQKKFGKISYTGQLVNLIPLDNVIPRDAAVVISAVAKERKLPWYKLAAFDKAVTNYQIALDEKAGVLDETKEQRVANGFHFGKELQVPGMSYEAHIRTMALAMANNPGRPWSDLIQDVSKHIKPEDVLGLTSKIEAYEKQYAAGKFQVTTAQLKDWNDVAKLVSERSPQKSLDQTISQAKRETEHQTHETRQPVHEQEREK